MNSLILAILPTILSAMPMPEFSVGSYPNPRKGGQACNMLSVSNICDPDETLTQSERYRLNNELQKLSRRTEVNNGNFCSRKGIDAVLVIMTDGTQQFADKLNQQWNLDGQCQRAAIFLLSSSDRKIYYAGESQTGITQNDFIAIVSSQEKPLHKGEFTSALTNIFKELGNKQQNGLPPASAPGTPVQPNRPQDFGRSSSTTYTLFATFLLVLVTLF